MKDMLLELAAYNIWANEQLGACIATMSEEDLRRELLSSFKSVHATLAHILMAEDIWWKRRHEPDAVRTRVGNDGETSADLIRELKQQNTTWATWIQGATSEELEHVFEYRTIKGDTFSSPTYQMLMHVFNHGTFHRGQIVNMLRQLDVGNIPATDFIVWCR
ncbi:MAG: DinB family protein [bacterium]|nr:DinB family protein [bacterium]